MSAGGMKALLKKTANKKERENDRLRQQLIAQIRANPRGTHFRIEEQAA